PDLWPRRALLPRRQPGPLGATGNITGAGPTLGAPRARRTTRTTPWPPCRRSRPPAGALDIVSGVQPAHWLPAAIRATGPKEAGWRSPPVPGRASPTCAVTVTRRLPSRP